MGRDKLKGLLIIILAVVVTGCSSEPSSNGVAEDLYFPLPDETPELVESEDQYFYVETVVTDLEMPWGMLFLPDGKMLITEKAGNLRLVENGELQSEPVEGAPEVFNEGQGGLLDLEIHPNYEENGWIYISYSNPGDDGGHTAIMRAKLQENELVDREVLFEGGPFSDAGQHFGSRIEFDNDGFLYFSIGDRGEMENAQNLSNHSGKTFRLNDDGTVPEDNPFVDEEDAQPEIFTYGNRNPQGLALNPETGDLWEHEHGPRGGDEINILAGGANYGWPEITYGINYDSTIISEDTARTGMEQPIHYWDPSIAPSGMDFLDSEKYEGWKNDLFVGSLSFQYLHRIVIEDNEVVKEEELLEDEGRVRDVKKGPDGFLYVMVENQGEILRLLPAEN